MTGPAAAWVRSRWRGLLAKLRSPRVIVAEVLAIGAASALGALLPQVGADASALTDVSPRLATLIHLAALDRVFQSAWFLALVLLALASLTVTQIDQWRRVARTWAAPVDVSHFASAQHRRVLTRTTRGAASRRVRTEGRVGLLGSPLFHLGLVVLTIAGLVTMLASRDAVVDLFEGETLEAEPGAFGAQWGGALSSPLRLPARLRVDRLRVERYPSGELKGLVANATLESGRVVNVGVNEPLELGGVDFHLTPVVGPTAMLELSGPAGIAGRAVVLRPSADEGYSAVATLEGGLETRVWTRDGADEIELRVLRGPALLFAGRLSAGSATTLASGERISLHSLRPWARFTASRNPATPLIWLGVLLIVVGAVVMVTVVRVDTAVVTTPTDAGEEVLVALRAQRHPALFADKFERLVAACARGGT